MKKMMICFLGTMAMGTLGCVTYVEGKLTYDPAKVIEPPAGADEATAALVAFYGLNPAPKVYWYGGEDLDCEEGSAFVDSEGDCVQGVTRHDEFTIISNYWALEYGLISDTALPHELGHSASWQRGEGGDRSHTGHFFAPGGEVEQAYNMLTEMGL